MRLRKKPHTDEKLQAFADFVTVGDVQPISNDSARELHVELSTRQDGFDKRRSRR